MYLLYNKCLFNNLDIHHKLFFKTKYSIPKIVNNVSKDMQQMTQANDICQIHFCVSAKILYLQKSSADILYNGQCFMKLDFKCNELTFPCFNLQTRIVRESDYSPATALSSSKKAKF